MIELLKEIEASIEGKGKKAAQLTEEVRQLKELYAKISNGNHEVIETVNTIINWQSKSGFKFSWERNK